MAKKKARDRIRRIELVGELDAHAAEALALEIRRLANRGARDVVEVRVETVRVRGKLALP